MLFLIDSLDAVPLRQIKSSLLIKFILEIEDKYPDSKIIGTSRSPLHALDYFSKYYIQPFNQGEIIEYLSKRTQKWQRLYEEMSESILYSNLLSTPFFLDLFCRFQENLLSKDKLFDPILFREYYHQYLINGIPSLKQSRVEVEIFLEKIAARLSLREENHLKPDELMRIGRDIFLPSNTERIVTEIINAFKGSLLIESEFMNYSFLHINIQEFYFTKYLRRLVNNPPNFSELDYQKDILLGVHLNRLRSESGIRSFIKQITKLTSEFDTSIVPVYAIKGSIEIALAIGGAFIYVISSALKKFLDSYAGRFGEWLADYTIGTEAGKIELPPELDSITPTWIKSNPALLIRYSNALVDIYAKNIIEEVNTRRQLDLAKSFLELLIRLKFGERAEVIPPMKIIYKKNNRK